MIIAIICISIIIIIIVIMIVLWIARIISRRVASFGYVG